MAPLTCDGPLADSQSIVFSGDNRGDQYPGARIIAAQKATTANSFSLPGLAMSTANCYGLVQPGGSAFGFQESMPVNTAAVYDGPASDWGMGEKDPMVNQRSGGINVFGGGLALYDETGTLLGGLGTAGDTSCTDHIVSWRLRHELGLDYVPAGMGPGAVKDNMMFGGSGLDPASHPRCDPAANAIVEDLPNTHPTRTVAPK
ncbi:hypothetical protein HYH03_005872 [Edaphochlamys debaryana]|uniref:Uncharacterized protein n=1 Tax=Edaphochlamys debaryana TaxID=47281 RepID=A0A836C0K8_9CHLO|nr:hypothetical protein HYH03_005872 [Edaphochlamys debaryana]|eukprot:KAG2495941.1 hypothetical protein HYH03_005872 [Edaphochlamys debaryana]